ncbi:MAG: HAD hydrolase family protein [Pseudomonadota bacterium]
MSVDRARIVLVVFDVDGVFTDGRFTYDEDGRESKTFHTQDGYGIRRLLAAGREVGVITGRRSGAVSARMNELGVRHVIQGCRDKLSALIDMLDMLGVPPEHCAFVGDDIPDLASMQHVGLAIAVANAVADVRAAADIVTNASGGGGAVREVCDWLLAGAAKS